ncbi:MAG: GNVR domain-containing protein [Rubrivivax sp.]|nr:GNVR domain-containing protein [Rubrivivax sp.]
MSPGQCGAVLQGRRRLVLAIFGSVVLAVLAASLLRAPVFTATATLVVDPRPDPLAAPAAGGSGSLGAAAFLATQADILRHERVARQALAGLSAPTQALLRARWQDDTAGSVDFQPWAVDLLGRHLAVRLAREGGVVGVSHSAADPRFAAEVANAWVQAYLETSLELRVQPARQYARFFEQRAQAARAALEEAQGRLSSFQKARGIVATDERLDIENARLGELSSQLTALQATSSESASRQAQARGTQADRLQEVLGDGTVSQIKADIGRAEAQLQQLGTRLGDRHPQVQEQRAQLAHMRQRLEAETQRVAGGVGVADRINRQRLAETHAALDAQRAQVLRMKAVRDEGGVLLREVEQAQRSFDALLQRLAQSRLEGEATGGPASVLAWAEPPIEPSSPHPLLSVALALLLGALLAVGVALGLEWRQRRVRCAEDVSTLLQLPLLLSLPRGATKGP